MTMKLTIAAAVTLAVMVGITGLVWQIGGVNGEQETHLPAIEPREEGPVQDDDISPDVNSTDGGAEESLPKEDTPPPKETDVANDPPEEQEPEPEPEPAPLVDPDWGNLSGTFVFDGEAPAAEKIVLSQDAAYCGKHPLVDESLVVDPNSRGLKNVIVFLYLSRDDAGPKIHSSYEGRKKEPVVIDNVRCRFEPHVALLWTEQKLQMKNSDSIGHNAKIDSFVNPVNPLIPPGADFDVKFDEPERLPCSVSCNIHPWMQGWVVIKEHPYMAVTDAQGNFRIDNLPVGKWTFQFWHEKIGYVREVKQSGKQQDWPRGRLEIEIKPGENNLGKFAVPAEE